MAAPLPALLAWAQAAGWLHQNLIQAQSETSRTLVAAQPLPVQTNQAGTVLGRLPTCAACEVGQVGSPHTRLALFLLQRQDQWRPYFHILPRDFSRFPLFDFQSAEAGLQGSPTLVKLKECQAAIQQEWTDVCRRDPATQLSLQAFQEARQLVASRSFSVRVGGLSQPCLAPLVDMLNHSLSPNVAWKQLGVQIELYCLRDIAALEELTCSYGPKSNSALLINYGFVLPNNPYEEYSLTLTLPVSAKGHEVKKGMLGSRNFRVYPIPLTLKPASFEPVLGFARFVQLRDMGKLPLVYAQAQDPDLGGFDPERVPAISLLNELDSLKFLQEQASQGLLDPEQHTEGLLGDCQTVVQGEQKALKGLLHFLETALRLLVTTEPPSSLEPSWQAYFSLLTRFAANGV